MAMECKKGPPRGSGAAGRPAAGAGRGGAGAAGGGQSQVQVRGAEPGVWWEIQDLVVSETLPQMVTLAEAYLQIFERQ